MMLGKLESWEAQLSAHSLPKWSQLPELDLYMDQVVLLLTRYLSFPPRGEGEEKIITASIVNNYVRMRIMPAPVKKKYNRVHLAYLLVICSLKQSLSIASIQKMMPMGLDEQSVALHYDHFVDLYSLIVSEFSKYSHMMLKSTPPDGSTLISTAAIISNLSTSLTEYLLTPETEENL